MESCADRTKHVFRWLAFGVGRLLTGATAAAAAAVVLYFAGADC